MYFLQKNFKYLIALALICINSFTLPSAAATVLKSDIARLINEGMNYHNNRNYLLAIQSFEQAHQLDPENPQILANLSIVHNNYGKYLAERTDGKGAAREFRNALYYNSGNTVARSNLEFKLKEMNIESTDYTKRIQEARRERTEENFYAAISELREANKVKETVEAYLEIGANYHLLALKSGMQDSPYIVYAVDAFNKANSLDTMDPRPLLRLGDVNISTGKINKGIDYYQEAIRKDPENAEAQNALINGWLAAIRIAPNLANNHVGLGTAYQLKGDFLQAERCFRRALQIETGNQLAIKGLETLQADRVRTQVALFLDRAIAAQKAGNYDESLSYYIKALNLEPANPDIHFNIGTAFQAKGDYARAKKAYAKAIELDPKDSEAQDAIASLNDQQQDKLITDAFSQAIKLQEAGNHAEALKIYNRISRDKSTDDSLFYNMAVSYQALGDYDNAILNFKKASTLKRDPNYETAIKAVEVSKANNLLAKAVDLQSKADNVNAIKNYEEVVKIVPDNADAWYNLGTAYQATGDDSKALEAYKKAIALDEKNQTEAIFFAALILEEQKKLLEAMDFYNKYISLSPTGDYAGEAKQRQEYIKSFL